MQWLIKWLRVHSILENSLGFVSENVENVSMQKLGGGGGGGGGGGIRNFRANDAKYFLCSQGVVGASGIFSFLEMEFIRSWAKKKTVRSRR